MSTLATPPNFSIRKFIVFLFIAALLGCDLSGKTHAAQDTYSFEAAPNSYNYHILRNGNKIGEYNFVVDENGSVKNVKAAMNVRVMLGPVTVYKARHMRTETWSNDALISMNGQSTYNNDSYEMSLKRDGYHYIWRVNDTETTIEEDVITVTPWQPKNWHSGLLLTEKGKTKSITRAYMGETKWGEKPDQIVAHHYKISGDRERELWYDENGTLIGLKYEKDGADITFEYQKPFTNVSLPVKH